MAPTYSKKPAPGDVLLSTHEVADMLNCHYITVLKKMAINPETGKPADPDFPEPIRVSAKRNGWWRSWIEQYIASRPMRGEARQREVA
jgi:predicted DNA-binding transcriptional regulator AlpA